MGAGPAPGGETVALERREKVGDVRPLEALEAAAAALGREASEAREIPAVGLQGARREPALHGRVLQEPVDGRSDLIHRGPSRPPPADPRVDSAGDRGR